MMTVILRVEVAGTWDAGTRLQVYTDRGTGTVDLAAPLLAQPQPVFPGAVPTRGFGREPFGRGGFGTGRPAAHRRGGFGHQPFGRSPFGGSQPYVEISVTVPTAWDVWKFAVEAVDAAGNAQSDALTEITQRVSGTEPPPLKALTFRSYDAGTENFTLFVWANVEE